MRILREWAVRLWETLASGRSDQDIEDELRAHLAFAGEDRRLNAVAGRTHGLAQAMEAVRDQRGVPWLRDLGRDLRYALRGVVREPQLPAIAVASLALAIGAATAAYGFVDALLLRPLPVRDPGSLVFLESVGRAGSAGAPPYPCFERFRREATAFAGMAAYAGDQLRIEVDGTPEQVDGQVASGNYFDLLGVRPALGRLLRQEDESLGPPVAVLGYGYWQRRFGGDPAVIGRGIRSGDRTFTIVGVTEPSFRGLQPGRQLDVTFPITVERTAMADAGDWWFRAVARLAPGASRQDGTAQLDAIFRSFMRGHAGIGMRSRLKPCGG